MDFAMLLVGIGGLLLTGIGSWAAVVAVRHSRSKGEGTKPPKPKPKPVQLYSRVIHSAEGTVRNDHRLFERRVYNAEVGLPEWDIAPLIPGPAEQVAYRSHEEPFQVVTILTAPDADIDFTPILPR